MRINLKHLAEVNQILEAIDDDYHHPANDAHHPNHKACVEAYNALAAWRDEQHVLIEHERRRIRHLNREF